ncbi:MAG TPA: hypothetical protein VMS56_14650 [Thermoanaerobaculia bacterium]|nr:hypothetical protein [Thermoanaerobaculia bacterium]
MSRPFLPALGIALALAWTLGGCTGGQETSAETLDRAEARQQAADAPSLDARAKLIELGPAIPIYAGARFREDFTRRDAVMVRNEFGDGAEVLTLASDDAIPKVWHYYVTYLAQYRAWEPPPAFPPEKKNWRTLEVDLTEAMQDPFVPGTNLKATDRRVILQISETEAEPPTIIRYIITPQSPQGHVTVAAR